MKTKFYVMVVAVMLCMESCEHKDLVYTDPDTVSLEVIFDWSNAPDADPSSMRLYLYPKDGREMLHYGFTNRTGGTIRVPRGDYDALFMNDDTENNVYRNMESPRTFEVSTRSVTDLSGSISSVLPVGPSVHTRGNRYAMETSKLWSGSKENIILFPSSKTQKLTVYPDISYCTYTVEIRNLKNLISVYDLGATLSHLSGGLLPWTNGKTGEEVTVPLWLAKSGDRTIRGSFLTFGDHPETAEGCLLTIGVTLSDGQKWSHTVDVTEQVRSAKDPRNVLIALDGLEIPTSEGGNGFGIEIDEWSDSIIYVPM